MGTTTPKAWPTTSPPRGALGRKCKLSSKKFSPQNSRVIPHEQRQVKRLRAFISPRRRRRWPYSSRIRKTFYGTHAGFRRERRPPWPSLSDGARLGGGVVGVSRRPVDLARAED